jgi:hypothetical protein
MSIEAINWALNRVTGITSTQKAILIALADRANEDHQCWPSYDDICFRSGANRKSVVAALKKLEELGVIERNRRFSKSTVYTLAISTDIGPIQKYQYRADDRPKYGHNDRPNIGPLTINESSKETPKAKHSRKVPEGVDPDVWKDWVQYRRKFKAPCTDRSLTLVANKLKEVSFSEQRECVDRAIECGWKSVFPKTTNSTTGELVI